MATYPEMTDLAAARAHVDAMLATPIGKSYPAELLCYIRHHAAEEYARADGSQLPDAAGRALGASLVLIVVGER